MPHMRKIAFLDRDGTIIVDKHYLSDPKGIELLPNAAEGLKILVDSGYELVIVSNQSGIGRGYFSESDLKACMDKLEELLGNYKITFADVLFCPHAPDQDCTCRKPLTGMITDSKIEFDPKQSVVIGDKACDVELGQNIGSEGILVRTGKGAKEEEKQTCKPDFIGDDLKEVARYLAAKKG